jgi:hypothetical protein
MYYLLYETTFHFEIKYTRINFQKSIFLSQMIYFAHLTLKENWGKLN